MSDNKPSRFNNSMTTSSSISTTSASTSTTSASSLIDKFYDNRKHLFDICGNVINKDKYQFISILSTYLVDIVNSIDIEINKSTRNSMINWREKKNPKLLSKFINSDDNINIINRSMNKITSSNYMSIASEISDTLMQDNFRKIPEYSKFLFDTIIKKCLNDEKFATDYLHFLVSFEGVIGKNINQYINDFIAEVFSLLKNSNYFKCNDSTSYFSYIKDISQYMNIGIILANLYLIKNESNTAISNIKMYLIFTETVFYEKFIACLNHINEYLEWLPSDMNDIIGRIYLVFGIIEIIGNKLLEILTVEDRNFLNDILTLIYNVNSIPNKIKFKVLDIQDVIKSFNKSKQNLIKSLPTLSLSESLSKTLDITSIITNVDENKYDDSFTNITESIDIPIVKNTPKTNKPVGFSSMKLVQMQSYKTQSEIIPKIEDVNRTVVEVTKPVLEVTKPVIEVTKPVNDKYNKKQDKDSNNRNYNRNRNKNKNGNSNCKNNDQSNISINNTSNTSIDDDGFIKIERKSRIINEPQIKSNNNSNNFRQKDKQKNN